jgi:hypothetical protein
LKFRDFVVSATKEFRVLTLQFIVVCVSVDHRLTELLNLFALFLEELLARVSSRKLFIQESVMNDPG